MSLLGMVLESYSGFVAGKIWNPMLTKEDYDQIDAEEMELVDIKWCLASVLRRAEKFKQITGRNDLREANISTLGHFKRECTNREESGAQNPFNNNNDYYRKAIYHQVAQQPPQQQQHQAQTAHGRNLIIDQDDERLPEGFSWENFTWDDYVPDQATAHTAFVARIEEDSDDDGTKYYARRMAEHLKMMAKSDSEDEKSKKKKKKVKTPVSSDDESVPVVRQKV
ncbi:hypothetical protein HanLR1_Chr01g0005171 [Helianthus annuus]|nr:hypothetical protein HanHA89_Chr01g0005931 [Helianthus annuus]KAJ0782178.1 hypothetical protein HanLR1_Chr01g0005171 [Helianthus annuus]